jgi:hypothetical protein
MASAYDEIKKALVMLRHGEPITEQSRSELNRVRRSLEQELATDELPPSNLVPTIRETHGVTKDSFAARKSCES